MMNKVISVGYIIGNGDIALETITKNDAIVILKESNTDISRFSEYNAVTISMTKVGKILKFFRKNNIKSICFIGGITRPALSLVKLRPDFTGLFLLLTLLKLKKHGDDSVLQEIISFMEKRNFHVIGIHEINKTLLADMNLQTTILPSKQNLLDIDLGARVLNHISQFDIGQSIVIQDGIVIGIEGVEGTDELVIRCGKIAKTSTNRPVLIKLMKIGQNMKADMPTIGTKTIEYLSEFNFSGIAIQNNKCLVQNKSMVKSYAESKNVFITIVE